MRKAVKLVRRVVRSGGFKRGTCRGLPTWGLSQELPSFLYSGGESRQLDWLVYLGLSGALPTVRSSRDVICANEWWFSCESPVRSWNGIGGGWFVFLGLQDLFTFFSHYFLSPPISLTDSGLESVFSGVSTHSHVNKCTYFFLLLFFCCFTFRRVPSIFHRCGTPELDLFPSWHGVIRSGGQPHYPFEV